MKLRTVLLAVGCVISSTTFAQTINGSYVSEWGWGMSTGRTIFANYLRFDFNWSPWKNGTILAATEHVAITNSAGPGPLIDDMQLYSNIYGKSHIAAITLLGYQHAWKHFDLFVGIRNTNQDFFKSEATSVFTGCSLGIFPTISTSYPIPNYPVSSPNITFNIRFGNWTITNGLYNGVGYSGWKGSDNPFLIRPKRDGIFDELQVAYETESNFYSVGAAMHTKEFTFERRNKEIARDTKFSAALWIYGEQDVWHGVHDQKVRLMAQLSFNTNKNSACTSYAEVGCVYQYDKKNTIGVSGQYGRFHEIPESDMETENPFEKEKIDEFSVEVTWKHEFSKIIAVQPAFHYVNTGGQNNTVLLGRLLVSF